jgi:hypothetical protein
VELTPQTVVVQARPLVATEVDGDLVMMDIEGGHYLTLNPTGARIWDLIAEPRSVADICSALTARFNVTDDQCLADVTAFLTSAMSHGAVARR